MEKILVEEINYKRLEPVLQRINQNNINPSDNITHKYNLYYRNFLKTFQHILTTNNSFLDKYLKVCTFIFLCVCYNSITYLFYNNDFDRFSPRN